MKIIEPIQDFGIDLFSSFTIHVDSILQMQDITITIFTSTFIISYIVFYFIIKFAPVFSEFKLTLMISAFMAFLASNVMEFNKAEMSYNDKLLELSMTAGGIWIFVIIALSISAIMNAPYYERLFQIGKNK